MVVLAKLSLLGECVLGFLAATLTRVDALVLSHQEEIDAADAHKHSPVRFTHNV